LLTGKTQTVERLLPDIVSGLEVLLANERARREENEERQRQWAEMSRRRDLAKRRKEREQKRIEYLRNLVELQREAADIRTWLASLPADKLESEAADLGRMLAWASERLATLDQATTIDAAKATLNGLLLFPELDELHNPLGDPPERRGYW